MEPMDEIYQKYARTVYKFLLSKVQNEDLAEELTQETFYQAVRSIDRFNGSCQITTWLCAIARNQMLAYFRKHPPTEQMEDHDLGIPSAESDVLDRLGHLELMKRLHSCPEPFREILYLRIFGQLSFREIAEIMGRSENWARVTFYRGKEKLRQELEQEV